MLNKESVRSYLKRSKLLRKLVRSTRITRSRYFKDFVVIEGKDAKSQQSLRILFSGKDNSMHYVIDTIFKDSEIQIHKSRIWNKRIWGYAQSNNTKHDLAIIQTDTVPQIVKSAKNAFVLPSWVGGEKDLNKGVYLAGHDSQIKSDIRRIRRNRLGYRVTNDNKDFDDFYHKMYIPHIKNVYGNFAFLMTYEEMKAAIPHSQLFLITQDGVDIAGGIHVYYGDKHDRVRAWSIGVKDGDRNYVKMGALSALDYFETIYFQEKGYSQLHKVASRPFLNDGVLRFKLKRGMAITDHTEQYLVLFALNNSHGVREFLHNNPFIFLDREELQGAIFISPDTPCNQDIADGLYKKWTASDTVDLNIFSVRGNKDSDSFIELRGKIDEAGRLRELQ